MPLAARVGDVVYVHTPALHVAVPFWVPAPVIATDTVAGSPAAVPHEPPTVVTVVLVVYGKVRAVPLTVVRVTTGAVVSTVIVFAPLVALLVAASVCVAVTEYAPLTARLLTNVYVHAPATHAEAPFSLPAPVTETDTVGVSPLATPHAPPTVVATAFVRKGNVRAVPLTVVSVTTGSVLSTVMAWAPLVPTLLALSDWVAVTV